MASIKEKLSELTVPELQKELKSRGLKRSGVKAKLIERLSEAIEAENIAAAEQGSFQVGGAAVSQQNVYPGSSPLPQAGMLNLPQLQQQASQQQESMQLFLSQQQQQPAVHEQSQLFHPQMLAQHQLQGQVGQQDGALLPSMNQLLGGQLLPDPGHQSQSMHMQQQAKQQRHDMLLLQQQQQQQKRIEEEQQKQRLLEQQQQIEEEQKKQRLLEQEALQKQFEEEQQKQRLLEQEALQKQFEEEQQKQRLLEQEALQKRFEEEQQKQRLLEQEALQKQFEEEQQKQRLLEQEALQKQIEGEQRKQRLLEQQRHQKQIEEEQQKQRLLEQQQMEKQRQLLEHQHLEQQRREQQQLLEEQQKKQQQQLLEQRERELQKQQQQHKEKKRHEEEENQHQQELEKQERLATANTAQPEISTNEQPQQHNENVTEAAEAPADGNSRDITSNDTNTSSNTPCAVDSPTKHGSATERQHDDEVVPAEDDSMAFDVQPSEEDRKLTEDCDVQPCEEDKNQSEVSDVQAPVKLSRKIKPATTPVQIKKRKVAEQESEKPAVRKRRWGSASTKEPSITIDSGALKELIPDSVKQQDSNQQQSDVIEIIDDKQDNQETVEDVEPSQDETVEPSSNPTEDASDVEVVELSTSNTDVQEIDLVVPPPLSETKQVKVDFPTATVRAQLEKAVVFPDDGGLSGRRIHEAKEARNAPCSVVHVENLVRPFTLRQLKELLQQTGTLAEEGFWINKIKSFCFATYSSEEEAVASRAALDGIKWPASSPKVLRADFANLQQLHAKTGGALGEVNAVVAEEAVGEREQRPRITVDPQHRPRDAAVEKMLVRQVKEDSPAKMLDDLFRKTEAKPSLYWLPLTDEQVKEKEKAREERKELRQKNADGRDQDANRPLLRNETRQSRDQSNRRSSPPKRFPQRNYRQRSHSRSPIRSANRGGSYRS